VEGRRRWNRSTSDHHHDRHHYRGDLQTKGRCPLV
jgi:hypothetical protein